jgi:hypothetical protein
LDKQLASDQIADRYPDLRARPREQIAETQDLVDRRDSPAG